MAPLGQRLALDWRLACGDEVLPSAVVVDSRSLRSAPSAWARGIDGGKLVKGIKVFAACDKHGALLDLEGHPANTERLFAWMSRYRRLNIVYDGAPDLFAAHVWIAMISIIS